MSCPTCDHTMKNIGEARGEPIYYCWRCGTITDSIATEVPYLVSYCRGLVDRLKIRAPEVFAAEIEKSSVMDVLQ